LVLPGDGDRRLVPESGGRGGERSYARKPGARRDAEGDPPSPPGDGSAYYAHRSRQSYTGHAFRDLCLTNGILPSVGHTGICFDNAAAESFNATLKKELINLHGWSGPRAVKQAIFEYIEVYYSRRRIQKALDYRTPFEYELEIDTGAILVT
jgi:putative transposase